MIYSSVITKLYIHCPNQGAADQRLKMSNEMLQGIKLLKLYGWERIYYEAIKKARIKELSALLKVYILYGVTREFLYNVYR